MDNRIFCFRHRAQPRKLAHYNIQFYDHYENVSRSLNSCDKHVGDLIAGALNRSVEVKVTKVKQPRPRGEVGKDVAGFIL